MPKHREAHWRTYTHPRYKKMRWKTVRITATNKESGVPTPKPTKHYHSPEWALENSMVNKVILIGNLAADPEIRYTQNGVPVTSFRIATTEKWKDKNGNKQETTEWHNIVAWNRTAEICSEYLTKGSKVYIEGKLSTHPWEKEGQKHYTTSIVVREMKMLSPRKTDNSSDRTPPPMPESGYGSSHSHQEPPPMGEDVPF